MQPEKKSQLAEVLFTKLDEGNYAEAGRLLRGSDLGAPVVAAGALIENMMGESNQGKAEYLRESSYWKTTICVYIAKLFQSPEREQLELLHQLQHELKSIEEVPDQVSSTQLTKDLFDALYTGHYSKVGCLLKESKISATTFIAGSLLEAMMSTHDQGQPIDSRFQYTVLKYLENVLQSQDLDECQLTHPTQKQCELILAAIDVYKDSLVGIKDYLEVGYKKMDVGVTDSSWITKEGVTELLKDVLSLHNDSRVISISPEFSKEIAATIEMLIGIVGHVFSVQADDLYSMISSSRSAVERCCLERVISENQAPQEKPVIKVSQSHEPPTNYLGSAAVYAGSLAGASLAVSGLALFTSTPLALMTTAAVGTSALIAIFSTSLAILGIIALAGICYSATNCGLFGSESRADGVASNQHKPPRDAPIIKPF